MNAIWILLRNTQWSVNHGYENGWSPNGKAPDFFKARELQKTQMNEHSAGDWREDNRSRFCFFRFEHTQTHVPLWDIFLLPEGFRPSDASSSTAGFKLGRWIQEIVEDTFYCIWKVEDAQKDPVFIRRRRGLPQAVMQVEEMSNGKAKYVPSSEFLAVYTDNHTAYVITEMEKTASLRKLESLRDRL